jgi:cytoskeletal protein RodZ
MVMLERLSARVIAIIVGVALLMLVTAWALNQWQQKRAAQARERVSTNQAVAAVQSGKEAVETTSRNADRAHESERTAQEGKDAIDHAEGGNSNAAADRAACGMRAYRNSERCRTLLGTGADDVGAGRASR